MVKFAEDNSSGRNNKYRIKLFTEATTRGQQTVANTVGLYRRPPTLNF